MASPSMNVRQAEFFVLPEKGFNITTKNDVTISIKRMGGHDRSTRIENTTWEQYACYHKKPVPDGIGNIVHFNEVTGTYETVTNPVADNRFILLRNPANNRLILETKSQIARNFLYILKIQSKTNKDLNILTTPFNFSFDNIKVRSNTMKNLTTKAPQNEIRSINYSGPSIGEATPVNQAIAEHTATHTIVDIMINRISYTVGIGNSGQVYFMTQVINPRETLSQLLSMI